MSLNSQQYASTPLVAAGTTTTADTSFSQPTETTVGVIATALALGAQLEEIESICLGTSVAGILRLWACEGTVGVPIANIVNAATTATVTTTIPHGRTTGDRITMQGVFPIDYNVKNVAITVTSTTAFTYTMATTPASNLAGANAATVTAATQIPWQYSSTPAAPVYHLLKELPIAAVTASTTVQAFTAVLNQFTAGDFMPVNLSAGWSLRTTVSVTQTNAMQTIGRGGQN